MALSETLPPSLRLSPLDWPHSYSVPPVLSSGSYWRVGACFFPAPQLGLYSFKWQRKPSPGATVDTATCERAEWPGSQGGDWWARNQSSQRSGSHGHAEPQEPPRAHPMDPEDHCKHRTARGKKTQSAGKVLELFLSLWSWDTGLAYSQRTPRLEGTFLTFSAIALISQMRALCLQEGKGRVPLVAMRS